MRWALLLELYHPGWEVNNSSKANVLSPAPLRTQQHNQPRTPLMATRCLEVLVRQTHQVIPGRPSTLPLKLLPMPWLAVAMLVLAWLLIHRLLEREQHLLVPVRGIPHPVPRRTELLKSRLTIRSGRLTKTGIEVHQKRGRGE